MKTKLGNHFATDSFDAEVYFTIAITMPKMQPPDDTRTVLQELK